jgi:Domain of unknown function (DUF4389)
MTEAVAAAPDHHPVELTVTDDLRRSRLTVFFRLLLAIPHLVWLALWGVAMEIAVLVAWFAALFAGRVPGGLHDFLAAYVRYSTRVRAYILLLADPFPPFGSGGSYPVDAHVAPAEPQSRLTVFFRLLLAIPALLLVYVFTLVNNIIAFLGWFYCLAFGRMHEGMRNVSVWMLRYEVQTYAYVLLLTGRYPSFQGAPTV